MYLNVLKLGEIFWEISKEFFEIIEKFSEKA